MLAAARSTVSNIEAGRLRIDDRQAFLLDQHYKTGFLLQLLLHYARLGHDPKWFQQFSTYESQARVIKIYAGSVIPLPLQTEEYTRALLAAGRRRDIGAEAEVRMARQRALLDRDDPPWIWVVFDGAAIETWAARGIVILYMPGHVMLYLGADGEHLYAVSAISDFLTPCDGGKDSVHALDRVAVSTLEVGRGTERTAFIERITRLVVFAPADPDPA